MAIKDLQTLYDEGRVATTLDGSELLLIEQGGLSKVVTVETLAQHFMAYFEANSTCCGGGISCDGATNEAVVSPLGASPNSYTVTVDGTTLSSIYIDDIADELSLNHDITLTVVDGVGTFAYMGLNPTTRVSIVASDATPVEIDPSNTNPTAILDGSTVKFCLASA